MNQKEWQIILAGEGGQGLVFIGALLGEAAILDGKNASQTASYTIASRGGYTKAEVVISDTEISFPGVTEPNVILALSKEALLKYNDSLPPQCLLVYDSSIGKGKSDGLKRFALPFSVTVRQAEVKGQKVSLNLVALGAILSLIEMVSQEALREALNSRLFSKEMVKSNLNALRKGAELVKEVQNN